MSNDTQKRSFQSDHGEKISKKDADFLEKTGKTVLRPDDKPPRVVPDGAKRK